MMKSFVIMMVIMSLMVGTSMAAGECQNGVCPAELCCSQYGYCGSGPDYCGGAEEQMARGQPFAKSTDLPRSRKVQAAPVGVNTP